LECHPVEERVAGTACPRRSARSMPDPAP
jgi:hypothetical protein